MWDYTEKVKDHFLNPRNVGEIENPDALAEVGNIVCGDVLRLTLRIDRSTDKIIDAKFKTFGCASAIASSSILTEMIKGKTVDEAMRITNKDIAGTLGGLPEEKMHCSVLGMEALEAAIKNYRGITNAAKEPEDKSRIVCKCFGVTEAKIKRVVQENNLRTVAEVTNYCKAGGGCRSCHGEIEKIIAEVWKTKIDKREEKRAIRLSGPMTNIRRIQLVEETIEREIKPILRKDGGDIELIDVDRNKVKVRLKGVCSGCPSAGVTLKQFVESKLREFVEDTIEVEELK
ncbi:MAG: Fe-S cluster assembly protein NifU [Candidatus Omnitrophica bacterium]|nr:Fe-S cluster assembly protein NifU [Candidatus Omnitrophota bacterium]